jgi:P pilus assembly chaperone PapD
MSSNTLSTVRRSIHPKADDTWQTIAARELPHLPEAEAVQLLQSLNLHVFMRPAAPAGSPRQGNPILPSDVIFVEPPLRAG